MCKSASKMKQEQIPYGTILQPWINVYRSTPKLYIPFTDIDFAFSLVCATIFSILRIFFRHALYYLGWPVGAPDTYFASACMASFCHSSLILPGLAAVLLSQKYVPSGKLQTSPEWYQDATNALMSFCTGYMIYDSIMGYVVGTWQPGVGPVLTDDDWMYLGHHILTTLYMVSARAVKAGHMSAMILMFNGEFTAPIMNTHLILEKALVQEAFKNSTWLQVLFVYNDQFFSALYVLCRMVVSPFVIAHLS